MNHPPVPLPVKSKKIIRAIKLENILRAKSMLKGGDNEKQKDCDLGRLIRGSAVRIKGKITCQGENWN